MKLFLPNTLLRFSFLSVLMLFSILSFSQTYNQVTTTGGLTDGDYLIVGDGTSNDGIMLNTQDATPYINRTPITNPGTTITSGFSAGNVFQVTIISGVITIYNSSVGYVSFGRSGTNNNTAEFYVGTAANTERWTVSVNSGLWTLSNVGTPARLLQWNNNSPRFACYTSNQVKLKLYKKANPTAPNVITVAANSITTTSAALNGTINANGFNTDASFEYGTTATYGSSILATPSSVTGTTVTSISASLSSLALNTQYFYRAVGSISGTATNGANMSFYTLAATPGVLVVSNPSETGLDLNVNSTTENNNPSNTQYAIQETGGQYIQADGSLGATAVWQTASVWSTTTVIGLNNSTLYTFSVKARNGANVETVLGTSASGTTLAPDVVDYANIQSPFTAAITQGNTVTILAQVTEPGITDGLGQGAGISAEIGYSTTDSTPDGTWTWVPASYVADALSNDEYQAVLGSNLSPGTYYYASRFIKGGSTTYVYGGIAGIWSSGTSGVLTVVALGAPVANSASVVGVTSFTANWDAVLDATSYEIDVYEETTAYATDLFISEYVEGSGNNKYLEIYNGTGADVDLSDYEMHLFSNGSSTESPSTLSGILVNNSTLVLQNSAAALYSGVAVDNGAVNFNGDDAVALYKISTLSYVDIFGRIGNDPGSAWSGSGGYSTSNKTLVRNPDVVNGVVVNPTGTGNSAFTTLTTEWTLFNEDVVNNLGSHTFNGGTTATYVFNAMNVGDVTSFDVSGLNGNTTYHYVVRAILGSATSANSNVIDITTDDDTCIWSSLAWSNGTGPTEEIEATIADAYDTATYGDIVTKKLTIDAAGSLIVNSGTNVYVLNELINNATASDLVVESNGNLLQINDVSVNVNVGDMTVHRVTSPLKRLDYVLWSSPVQNQMLQAFSPSTLATRFYTYNPSTDLFNVVSSPSTTFFAEATGYLIRTPDNHPVVPTNWASVFTGYPNNGTISIPVAINTYNAVGNPYPSTMDGDAFIFDNGLDAGEALYFWRKDNNASNPSYATYTIAGGTANTGGNSALVPTSAIQVGQGFIAKSLTTSLNFTNSMRIADNDDLFLKSNGKSRIWLDLTNNSGLFCQTLIAYMPNATDGIDAGIDGRIFSQPANGATLTSIINNDSSFIIQGKGSFADTDIVALAFKTAVAGNFTITLSNVDGLFAGNAQDVFLKDNLTNTITNLTSANYTFATTAGDFLNRFEVVYKSPLLNTDDFVINDFIVYVADNDIIVNAGQSKIDAVKVYDMRGRLITEMANVNASEAALTVLSSNQVLLIQVATVDGVVVNKKIVK